MPGKVIRQASGDKFETLDDILRFIRPGHLVSSRCTLPSGTINLSVFRASSEYGLILARRQGRCGASFKRGNAADGRQNAIPPITILGAQLICPLTALARPDGATRSEDQESLPPVGGNQYLATLPRLPGRQGRTAHTALPGTDFRSIRYVFFSADWYEHSRSRLTRCAFAVIQRPPGRRA